MRTHVLFLILWILLLLSSGVEVLSELSQYRLTAGMESIMRGPPNPRGDDNAELDALLKQKQQHLLSVADAGVEILLLGGVCFCFFRAWGIRRESASPYVWTRKANNA
jgi:hypothetical protein